MSVTSLLPHVRGSVVVCIVLITTLYQVNQAAYLNPPSVPDSNLGKSVLVGTCPDLCVCDTTTLQISCAWEYGASDFTTIQNWSLINVTLTGNFTCLPEEINEQKKLNSIKVTNSLLSSLSCSSLRKLENLVTLDLSHNYISYLYGDNLASVSALKSLNLSHNRIDWIEKLTFENQLALEVLDLSYNRLESLADGVLDTLLNLRYLDLSYNKIVHLHDSVFKRLMKLKTLNLTNNKLVVMTFESINLLPALQTISLSGNSWECSCMIESMLTYLQSQPDKFMDVNGIPRCTNPRIVKNKPLIEVSIEDLPCPEPNISHVAHEQIVLARNNIHLKCGTSAFPHAQIYWMLPWGQVMAQNKVKLDWTQWNITSVKARREFAWPVECIDIHTVVYVGEHGGLHIENFHGSFAGKYVCVAVNQGGQTNVTIDVKVTSAIRSVFKESLIYGAGTSGVMLVIAIVVGIVKTCRSCCKKYSCCCCRCCCCCTDAEKSDKKSEIEEMERSPSMLDSYDEDESDDDSLSSTPKSPHSIIRSLSMSPKKVSTPTGESKERWTNISETLDEVKIRLDKKMEKVRSHVQSIKESGSQYINTIKDTGSQAAKSVRAGMVLGVEHVKFGVQSMKEFCGTGEMGTQTVSMISVSTDIDTQQQTKVVKSVTYV